MLELMKLSVDKVSARRWSKGSEVVDGWEDEEVVVETELLRALCDRSSTKLGKGL